MSKARVIPQFNTPLVETHCHLDRLKELPLEETLKAAGDLSVEQIITIAVEPENLETVIKLTEQHALVFGSQGIHPHDARQMTPACFEQIKQALKHPKIVAVGEIGLDYHYNHSPRDTQIQVFEQQLELAAHHDKPVIIHARDADDDMIALLKSFAPTLKRKGVIHSFSSGLRLAEVALELDFYLGFNGMLTFKKAELVREACALAPVDRLLAETDAPYLTPAPFRGKENGPQYLPLVVEAIAQIKQRSPEEIAPVLTANSRQLFSLPS